MNGRIFSGYAYSYITKAGDEKLVMASFGTTRSKSKKYLNYHNQIKLEPVKPHKRYAVQVMVVEEISNER
jgi:hypothetical protein